MRQRRQEAVAISFVGAEMAANEGQEGGERSVAAEHRFGAAGRAGGEGHVSEIVGGDGHLRCEGRRRQTGIERHDRHSGRRQHFDERGRQGAGRRQHDQGPWLGKLHIIEEPCRRVGGVEHGEGGPGAQNTEQGGGDRCRAVSPDRHHVAARNPGLDQGRGQA